MLITRGEKAKRSLRLSRTTIWRWGLALLPLVLLPLLFAQSVAKVTAIDPTSGKVNDSVTLTGENLGKDSVDAVNLSDADTDYKATVVEQSSGKIVMKVPQVKAGSYNLSIQVKDRILILPLRFEVTE
jgi:IPT/TIG domain